MMNKKVSIVCITYNQEKYIAQAIESFLMQKTDFDFEIIIADDSSTDSTPKIISQYAEKNPNIRLVLREKNIGPLNNYIETLALATGEYVIVNEGDDYFSDENKLQKQVEFLDANPDYTICFHPVLRYFEEDTKKNDVFPTEDMKRRIPEYTFENLLRENFIQTNSAMYRWNVIKDITKIFPKDILPGDWYLHLLFAKKGKIKCLEDVMSVYRINIKGVWYNSYKDRAALVIKNSNLILKFFIKVYENIFEKRIDAKVVLYKRYVEIFWIIYSQKEYIKLLRFVSQNFKLAKDIFIEKIILILKTLI